MDKSLVLLLDCYKSDPSRVDGWRSLEDSDLSPLANKEEGAPQYVASLAALGLLVGKENASSRLIKKNTRKRKISTSREHVAIFVDRFIVQKFNWNSTCPTRPNALALFGSF
jgi:hypothetical protein